MSKALRLVLLCWLLLSGTLWAEPLEIRFATLPPDCAVADLQAPDRPSTVGSVTLERPAPGQKLRFRLFKAGYASLAVEIPAQALPSGPRVTWPVQQGSYLRLEPLLVSATFHSNPQGAQIWTSRTGTSDDYLGLTGEPVLLNLADLVSEDEEERLRLRLVAPGYQSVEIPVPQHLFGPGRPNRWPAEGEYALAPTSGLWALLAFHLRLRPWASALAAVLLVSLALLLLRLAGQALGVVNKARRLERLTAQPGADLSGSRLGPYRLLEVLGRGGTATVFRAIPEDGKGEPLAVKVFHLGGESAERLAREVRPLLELRHANLVGLLDWGQEGRFTYLVTDLVPGRTLRQELEHGPLQLDRWRALADDLLSGLAYAHARGVVHGDVKPENLLLPWHGKAKLVDFGLAQQTLRPGLEKFGGTPGYLAPELSEKHELTPSTDQYAAGTLLFEALFGVFPGNPQWEPPEQKAELAAVLLRMRQTEPALRYDDLETARQAVGAARVASR